jgi:hypothetical protein
MPAPKGSARGARDTVTVYPGNRLSVVFSILGALVAADIGRGNVNRVGGIWVAPELAEMTAVTTDCGEMSPPPKELRFEKIALGDDVPMPSIVSFQWHPATGELSFSTQSTALSLPETLVTAASARSSRHCE